MRIPLRASSFLFNNLAFLRIPRKSLKFLTLLFSIPTAPTNHLLDGLGLNENTRGQKGADKANGPVFVREFSAVRVTTGFVRSGIQESFPKAPYVTSSQHCYECCGSPKRRTI
jgi:hypothetical protein